MRTSMLAGCTFLTTVALVAPALPASASGNSGHERFDGFLVATGTPANPRHVEKTEITARGIFAGFGHIVEIPNRPTDPDSVSRDDLVFRAGKMHLKSVNKSFRVRVDPQTCVLRGAIEQVGTISGGTGRFANAAGRLQGSVTIWGVTARGKNGACSTAKPLLLDVDVVSAHGSLTL